MRYLIALFVLIHCGANAQNSGPILDAMGSGGGAVTGIWALQQNPAGIASSKKAAFTIAYERHFLSEDVSTQTALFIIPVRDNVFGMSVDSYGFSDYKELQTGVFYARSFGESFRLAVGLKYHQLSITQYNSAATYSVEVGFQLKLSKEITIASHIANPNKSGYHNLPNASLPVKLSFGTSCRFNDRILMIADVRKVLNEPLDFMAGIEYNAINWLFLRGGVSANPFKQYSGFGIKHNKIHIDVSVGSHPDLGYSPQIALGYEF